MIKKKCDVIRNYYRIQPDFKNTFINQFLNKVQFLTDEQLSLQDKELLDKYFRQVPKTKKKRKEGQKKLSLLVP